MRIAHVVAMSTNGVIGNQGKLPWHLSADLQRFKKITMGACIIMGRKTYDSIGKPLPGRKTIVLSRKNLNLPATVAVVNSIDAALAVVSQQADFRKDEVYIVGGGEIYQATMALVDRIYLTRVAIEVTGDAFYTLNLSEFRLLQSEAQEDLGLRYTFECYERAPLA